MWTRRCLLLAIFLATGCDLQPIHAILTIEDPDMIAGAADAVAIGIDPAALEVRALADKHFPTTMVLTREQPYSGKVFAEARASEQVLARGQADLVIEADRAGAVTIRLARSCQGDSDCDDAVYCNGAEVCAEGVCVLGAPPCGDLGSDCASASCLEASQGCQVSVSHESCREGEYCDPVAGCVPGQGCYQDADCQDNFVCNGEERCISGLCAAGIAPEVVDADVCNLDACLEPGGAIHIFDPDADGRYCGTGQVCSAGACAPSSCDDGILDARSEECEDGNDNPSDECDRCRLVRWVPSVVVGAGAAIADPLSLSISPLDMGQDFAGNVYVTDRERHQVLRIGVNDAVGIIAGKGSAGFSGDGGPASAAELDTPSAVIADGLGNVFIGDGNNHRIRRVALGSGIITTHAGTGVAGNSGAPFTSALLAQLDTPAGLSLNAGGSPCFTDSARHVIRCADVPTGWIVDLAGTGVAGYAGDGGPGSMAQFNAPSALLYQPPSTFYVADTGNRRIRVIQGGVVRTLAGNGNGGASGDNGPALMAGMTPVDLALDGNNGLLLADGPNHRVRRIDLITNVITTIAGDGTLGSSGDGGPAINARLAYPGSLEVRPSGEILVAEVIGHRIRAIDTSGNIRTFMGNGRGGAADDRRPATTAVLIDPYDLTIDRVGNIYISDRTTNRVRKVDVSTGIIDTVAGGPPIPGVPDTSYGDGKSALSAQLEAPQGIDVDDDLNLYIADTFHVMIRRVDAASGLIHKVAPVGPPSFPFVFPTGLAVDPARAFYFTDLIPIVLRGDPVSNALSVWAGASPGTVGDNIVATTADLDSPVALDFDNAGNGYIGCTNRVRRVDRASGLISTVAGNGVNGDGASGVLAVNTSIGDISGIAISNNGTLAVGDRQFAKIREVNPTTRLIDTIAGTGVSGSTGDGGPAIAAQIAFESAIGMEYDPAGNLYFVDRGSRSVRKITRATGIITTVIGQVDGVAAGPTSSARLADPQALLRLPGASERWIVADGSGGRVVLVDRAAGELSPIAGYPGGFEGEDVEARFSRLLDEPAGVAFDAASQTLYVSERTGHVIRRIDMSLSPWRISTFAGVRGDADYVDGARADARFSSPAGLWFEASEGALYVADSGNHAVRRIVIGSGVVDTVMGQPGLRGFAGDGGDPRVAILDHPEALTHAPDGSWYLADRGNNRVRRVRGAVIDSVLGDGTAATSGQGSPARAFPVDSPRALAVDDHGNLYVSSRTALRMVIAGDDVIADGGDKVVTIYGSPNASAPPESLTRCLSGVVLADPGAAHVQILDACQGFLLEIERR